MINKAVSFIQYVMSGYWKKCKSIPGGKKHNFEETKQVSEWQGYWNYQTGNLKQL